MRGGFVLIALGLAVLGERPAYLQDAASEMEEAMEVQAGGSGLVREWEEQMKDFVPSDMITFELQPRSGEDFFELIEIVPSRVMGSFFVSSQETKDVDMTILAPDNSVLYSSQRRKEGLFHIDARERGIYVFRFLSRKFVEKLQVTFALHTGNSTDEPLDKAHITPVESGMLEVIKGIKDFQMEQQFSQLRQEAHFRTVQSANRNLFWFSLLECVGVMAVTTWQVYYIKKIMDHRRMI